LKLENDQHQLCQEVEIASSMQRISPMAKKKRCGGLCDNESKAKKMYWNWQKDKKKECSDLCDDGAKLDKKVYQCCKNVEVPAKNLESNSLEIDQFLKETKDRIVHNLQFPEKMNEQRESNFVDPLTKRTNEKIEELEAKLKFQQGLINTFQNIFMQQEEKNHEFEKFKKENENIDMRELIKFVKEFKKKQNENIE